MVIRTTLGRFCAVMRSGTKQKKKIWTTFCIHAWLIIVRMILSSLINSFFGSNSALSKKKKGRLDVADQNGVCTRELNPLGDYTYQFSNFGSNTNDIVTLPHGQSELDFLPAGKTPSYKPFLGKSSQDVPNCNSNSVERLSEFFKRRGEKPMKELDNIFSSSFLAWNTNQALNERYSPKPNAKRKNNRPSNASIFRTPYRRNFFKEPVLLQTVYLKKFKDIDFSLPKRYKEYYESLKFKNEAQIHPENAKDLASKPVLDIDVLTSSLSKIDMMKIFQMVENSNRDQVLVENFGQGITKKDICTLLGTNWLNDEIINFWTNLVHERCENHKSNREHSWPSCHHFNSFFWTTLSSDGRGYSYERVKRWTKKSDIFAKDKVIMPINLKNNHWCVAVINLKLKRFEYYDSLGGSNPICLNYLRRWLQDEWIDKKSDQSPHGNYSLEGWLDYVPSNIPHQENGYDCGVFSSMYIDYLSRDANFDFDQSHIKKVRLYMAISIIKNKLD